jgi:hypothetical protein
MKTYKAIMHFNKPAAKKGKPWTVHYRGTCYIVSKIDCRVPMVSEFKPMKKTNPRAFFTTRAATLTIKKGMAILA